MSTPHKRSRVYLPLLLSLVLVLGMLLGYQFNHSQPIQKNFFTVGTGNLLDQVLHLVHRNYVDSINESELSESAIEEMLGHLDPHSVYIPPKNLENITEEMQGNYYGIGISYIIIDDTVNITRVLEGGTAQNGQLSVGDQIIKVNDSTVSGVQLSSDHIHDLLHGPARSKVKLTVLREDSSFTKQLLRKAVPLKSLDAAYLIDSGMLYLKINRFSANTYREFMDAVTGWKQKATIKQCIVDLRGNSGGYLDASVNIADEFLDGNKLVVSTKGSHYHSKDFLCSKDGELEDVPLAVLVDAHSASASEIFAGAIQDWDRGYIIGRQTFGKGLVQEQYRLQNNGALRLTVARYYLPSGRLIQKPYAEGILAYDKELRGRYHHGELLHKDSIHFKDTTVYYTKEEHRPVYAESGIVPDLFVPIDTTTLSPYLLKIYRKNIPFRFSIAYFLKNKRALKALPNSRTLLEKEILNDTALQTMHKWVGKEETQEQALDDFEKKTLELQIKAYLARELWGEDYYFEILNQEDNVIQKAIQVLKENPSLTALDSISRG